MKVQEYVMKREEVPEYWLTISPADLARHLIDEMMDQEIDPEEELQ